MYKYMFAFRQYIDTYVYKYTLVRCNQKFSYVYLNKYVCVYVCMFDLLMCKCIHMYMCILKSTSSHV